MKLILISIVLVNAFVANCQGLGNWFSYLGNVNLSSRWTLHNEVQYRNYEFVRLEQLMIRNGVGFNLSENNNNLLQGYAYILAQPHDGTTGEHLFNAHRV